MRQVKFECSEDFYQRLNEERFRRNLTLRQLAIRALEWYFTLTKSIHHIVPTLGRIEPSKLGPQHVQQSVEDLLRKPKPRPGKKNQDSKGSAEAQDPAVPAPPDCLSPRTVKHCRHVLRAVLNVTMKWNLVSMNAAALARFAKPRKLKP